MERAAWAAHLRRTALTHLRRRPSRRRRRHLQSTRTPRPSVHSARFKNQIIPHDRPHPIPHFADPPPHHHHATCTLTSIPPPRWHSCCPPPSSFVSIIYRRCGAHGTTTLSARRREEGALAHVQHLAAHCRGAEWGSDAATRFPWVASRFGANPLRPPLN